MQLSVFRLRRSSKLNILAAFKHSLILLPKMAKHDFTTTPFSQKFIDGIFWNFGGRRQINVEKGTESFASISAAVFELSRKSGRGWYSPPPLPAGRMLTEPLVLFCHFYIQRDRYPTDVPKRQWNLTTQKCIHTNSVHLVWKTEDASISFFIPRLTGGEAIFCPHTSRFFVIFPEVTYGSSPNYHYPPNHQFDTTWQKENLLGLIRRTYMTSEWRHVFSVLGRNKGLRETLSRKQFKR